MTIRKCPTCGKFLPKGYIIGGGVFANLYFQHNCSRPRHRDGKFRKREPRSYHITAGRAFHEELNKILKEYVETH